MRAFQFAVLTAVVFAAGQVPTASLGGGEGGDGGYGGAAASHGLSSATTRSVVRTLTRGASRCGSQPWIYRYDCYRWVYKRAADQLTGNPAYSEAHKVMVQVERSLETAVNKNRDPSKPVRRRALETYKPIKPSAIPAVKRAADKALTNAETRLLRSPSNKQEHYARIAQAVNSNKVLLRSALMPGGLIRFASAILARLS
jgi:hypothetical protein